MLNMVTYTCLNGVVSKFLQARCNAGNETLWKQVTLPIPSLFIIFPVKMTILLIKSLIVGGLVYYTWSEGLWSDSERTSNIYDKLTAPKEAK